MSESNGTVSVISQVQSDFAEPPKPGTSKIYQGGKPYRRFILWYSLATAFITIVWSAVVNILLPNHVQMIEFQHWFVGADASVNLTFLNNLKDAVAHGAKATAEQLRLLNLLKQFEASRASSLALITSLGTIGTMLVQPVIGVFSDRTRSRFGRRAPWILFGSIVGAVFLAGMTVVPSIALLALFWVIAQAILNVAVGPFTATIADRVPEKRIGTVSSITGLGTMLGGLVGSVAVGALFASLGLSIYIYIAILVVIGFVGFVFRAPDSRSDELSVHKMNWGNFFRGFLVPLRDKDFRLAWIARTILMFGYTSSTALSLYMMQSYIHPAMSAADATKMVPLISLVGMPFTLIAMAISGKLSDKIGKRKPFVIVASLIMATGMAVPLISPTLPALFIQAAMSGAGMGVYIPVDAALFIDVLPDKNAAGRDLGVANLATNLGQSLGPILAGQIVAIFASYGMVWAVGLVLAFIAAVVILPIKRVK